MADIYGGAHDPKITLALSANGAVDLAKLATENIPKIDVDERIYKTAKLEVKKVTNI